MPEKTCPPDRFRYLDSIVLGMDDALVEFTGALAGFTVALGETRIIALAGFTTGVAATLSMAASEFMSQETAAGCKDPWTAALATGSAYLITVALLIMPYFFFSQPFVALALCLLLAGIIILAFTWSVARLKGTNFRKYFCRMLSISFCIAFIAFLIGWAARAWWGVEA